MDIIKISQDWAKDEIFSACFFTLFGLVFISSAFGFSQLGKQALAKAFISPLLVCGIVLIIIGVGLTYSNYNRLKSFSEVQQANSSAFIGVELERAEKTIAEFDLIVFKVIPLIIVICSIIIVFNDKEVYRAISLSIIGLMLVIMLVDSHSYMRLKGYKAQLLEHQNK